MLKRQAPAIGMPRRVPIASRQIERVVGAAVEVQQVQHPAARVEDARGRDGRPAQGRRRHTNARDTAADRGGRQQTAGLAAAAAFDNPLHAKRLHDAIASSLAARNLTVAAAGASADCVVSYAIGSRLAPDLVAAGYGWGPALGPPAGWGYYGATGGVMWAAPYGHREGRVSVNLFDARTQQALWHAYVDADVTALTGAEADQRIKAVVAAIFEKFPQTATATSVPAMGKP